MKLFRDAKLGRVLAIYASASFAVLQGVDLFQDRLDLPPWTFGAALLLLIIGLPIVITTAIVQARDFKLAFVEKNFTWRRALGGGIVAFTILVVTTGFFARDRFGGNDELDANLLAVFPFRVKGVEPSLQYLGEGMVDLLAAKLSGETGLRAADPRTALAAYKRISNEDPELEEIVRAARSIGARNVLLGEVVGTPAQLTIHASVINTRTGRRVQHFVAGPIDSLTNKVDELAAVLLSLDAGAPRDRLASLMTTSLPALRSYLAAESFARRSNHNEAIDAYAAALEADSTFALAAVGVIVEAGWGAAPATRPRGWGQRANRLAFENRDRLSELDRLNLMGWTGRNFPFPEGEVSKCHAYDQIVARAPDRAEAWHFLADCIYHFGYYSDVKDWQARAREAFEKSLALDSTFVPNIQHLVPLAALRRDEAELRRLIAIGEREGTTGAFMQEARWFVQYAAGRPVHELVRVDSLVDGKPNPTYASTRRLQHITELLIRTTDDIALADTLFGVILSRGRSTRAGEADPTTATHIAMLRGQHAEAVRQLHRLGGSWIALSGAMYSDIPRAAVTIYADSMEQQLRGMPEDSITRKWQLQLCVLEQWRLWNGDASRTDRVLELLRKPDPDSMQRANARASALVCAQMVESIRATVTKRPDALAQAVRLDSLSADFQRYFVLHSGLRIAASRLLELNGRTAEARVAVRRIEFDLGLPFFYGTQLLQEARLSAKLGETEEAIRNYRKYLALRTRADSSGQAVDAQVRHELALLTRDAGGR